MKFNAKSILILIIMTCLTVCLCGCGDGGSDEETVAITTVGEDQTSEAKDISVYESIYNTYDAKMSNAATKYAKELKAKADGMDKDDLYDLVKEKTDALGKIREEGTEKMTDKTLESTADDQEEYEKWYSKLNEAYTEYSRKITSIYTDQF